MQPTAARIRQLPVLLRRPASTMASIDSRFAASMKPQVFTTISSASLAERTGSSPNPASSASTRSESTVFLSQPIVMTLTFMRGS